MIKRILVLVCSIVILSNGFSQSKGIGNIQNNNTASSGVIRALIIGISDYKNIQKLTYAHSDALSFYRYLISPAGGNVDSNNIILLLNKKATAAQIYASLDALIDMTKEGDQIVFYFSGHGDLETKTIRQNGFLLGYDAPQAAYMSGGTIGINYLQDYMLTLAQKNKAKVLIITDACRSGKLAGGMDGVKLTASALQEQWQSVTKILSSQAGELSYEDKKWGNGGGGVFTYYMLLGLEGLADVNKDNKVNVSELFIYLSQNIPRETKFIQNPYIAGDMTSVLSKVDSLTLANLINQTKPSGGGGNDLAFKGFEDKILEGLDTVVKIEYEKFKQCISKSFLIQPDTACAWNIYQKMLSKPEANPIINNMKRSLLAALQDKAQITINLYLEGKNIPDSIDVYLAYNELEHAVNMIDSSYILYNHIKARYIFLKSSLYLTDNDEKIKYVSEGLKLEPDAAFGLFSLAYAYANKKEYKEAYKYYKKTLELAPRWAYAWNNLGTVFDANKIMDSALICYYKAIEFKVDMPEPYYNIGLTYYDQKKYAEAEIFQNKCLEYKSDYAKAYANLGWINYDNDRFEKALEMFAKASDYDYKNAGYKRNLGMTYTKLKEYSKAERYLKRSQELDTINRWTKYYLGELFEAKKDYIKALYYYRKCMENDTTFNFVYSDIGYVYLYDIVNYESAIKNYKKYIEYRPSSRTGYLGVGNSYYNMEKYEDAIKYYKLTIEKDPAYRAPYLYIGQSYSKLNNYNEALKYYKLAVSVDSNYAYGFSEMGKFFKLNKEYHKTINCYFKAISKDTSYQYLYYNIGDIYQYDKKINDSAIIFYKKYLEFYPNDNDTKVEIGNAYYFLQNYRKAITYYLNVINSDPEKRSPYIGLGSSYLKLGILDSAEYSYRRAIHYSPKYALGYSNLADMYNSQGKSDSAIANYIKAMTVDSSYRYLDYTVGHLFLTAKNYEKAKYYFEDYTKVYPDLYYGYSGIGYVYLKQGKNKKAQEYFELALSKNEKEPWSYYNLACFYALTNNSSKGLEYLEKALQNGFDNFDHLETDTDIDNLRNLPQFKAIIEKYKK
jgi:tetratricopeptide (TPR) repeat protein